MPCFRPTLDRRGLMPLRYGGFTAQGFTYYFFVGPAAVFLSLYSLRLLNPDLWDAKPYVPGFSPLPNQASHWKSSRLYYVAILVHIGSGCLTMALGAIQFIPAVRLKWIGYHKLAGKLYTFSGLVAILSLLMLLPVMGKGPMSRMNYELQVAVICTVVVWVFTIAKALNYVRQGDLPGHNRWMVRNYSTTMVIFTLRFFGVLGMLMLSLWRGSLELQDVYQASHDAFAPGCWVAGFFNFGVSEWYLRYEMKMVGRTEPQELQGEYVQVESSGQEVDLCELAAANDQHTSL